MKLQNSLFLGILLILGAMHVGAQGFAGFSYPAADSQQTISTPIADTRTMFKNYLATHFPKELAQDNATRVFLLIPENGCEYCIGHAVRYYQDQKKQLSGLNMIIAGHSRVAATHHLKQEEALHDLQSACKTYGFDDAFPTLGFLRGNEVLKIVVTESKTIDKELAQVEAYLQGK